MKTCLNMRILALAAVLLSLATFAPLSASACNLTLTEIKVSSIQDHTALLSWNTADYKTTAYVYVGENKLSLSQVYSYDAFSNDHSLELTDLSADETYYYKIVATDRSGNSKDSGVKSFSTRSMIITRTPQFSAVEIADNQDGRIALHLVTDEEVSVSVEYGTSTAYGRRLSASNYVLQHDIVITGLDSAVYYLHINVHDHYGNTNDRYLSTNVYKRVEEELAITGLSAQSGSTYTSGRSALIRFNTTAAAKSRVSYGTSANALSKRLDISTARETVHGIQLEDLTPNTSYYYRVEAYDSASGKSVKSSVLSFWTGDVRKWYATGSFVRAYGDKRVYIIYAGTKAWIENPAAFLSLGFKGEWIQDVPVWTLEDYQETTSVKNFDVHPSGSLVKYAGNPTVYLVEGKTKHPISSVAAFESNGFSWDHVVTISKGETYRTGSNVN
jgi:hypothetical protein